ncbi:hypothetical protein MTR67_025999 [Solanum verrucosum]|uniref:Endonuclease/exonuclease/phosphatase domain-containing protein n=1 Tax=Solanum verrucosum TaxID=315347 RepID=A0AAF0R6V6_SOLVR|nr:hypothetical protein MTR67_025999 [Solanum verrucosum]
MTSKGKAPTLTEVRRWASSLWKRVHGLNIYDMGEGFCPFRICIQGNSGTSSRRGLGMEKLAGENAVVESNSVDGEAPAKVTIGENNIQSSSEKVFTQRSPIDGPKVFVEDSVVLRGAADKVVQPRAMAETRGENFRTPNVDLGLRVSSNKSLNVDLGLRVSSNNSLNADLSFRVSGSKSLNATLGQLGQFSPNISGKNKEVAHDGHMPFNEGMNEIKILASQFLEALSHWESPSKLPQGEISMEKGPTPMKTQGEKSDIHQETASQNMIDESGVMKLQEKGDCSMETDVGCEEQNMQIHDVEPVDSNIPRKTNGEEIEASNWINSHILELSSTYGVAFEGFREETLALLMRLDERKFALENKMIEDIYCFQETKVNKGVENIVKQLWSSRWMRCGYIEADGSRGGILIMWDCRIWTGSMVEIGQYSITYRFDAVQSSFSWFLTGVYAPHTRSEKLDCWEEVAAVKELCEGPWVTCGDFNTVRVMAERRGCNRITNVMTDFSSWIEEMELHDPHQNGGIFTWFRGANHHSAARLDRKSYFKFENWWLNVDGFEGLVHSWWNEFEVEGCPNYKLSVKLKMLKQKLKDWSKSVCGELCNRKDSVLKELVDIDLAQNTRTLSEDELLVRATVLVELEDLAKNEESRWRQKSRVLWQKQGDNNTRFF